MAGKKAAPLNLSPRQGKILSVHQRKYSTGQQESKRIEIILKAAQGDSTYSIAKDIKMSIDRVREWRKRWSIGYEILQTYEQGKEGKIVSDHSLLKKMLELLKDCPRPGAPCRITESEKEQLMTVACRKPSDYNIPRTKWTNELLAQVVQQEGIIDKVSPRYVGKLLKKTTCVPIRVDTGSFPR